MTLGKPPVLGIIGHCELKEPGFVEIMRVAECVAIAPPDSMLHRMLDYSAPIQSLDCSIADLRAVVDSLYKRDICLNGILSLRDGNVQQAAVLNAEIQGRNNIDRVQEQYARLSDKSEFRGWLNELVETHDGPLCQPVPYEAIPPGLSYSSFEQLVKRLFKKCSDGSTAVLKPSRGSCSSHVCSVDDSSKTCIDASWETYSKASGYRGGGFIIEQFIDGPEYSIETVFTESVLGLYVSAYAEPDRKQFYTKGASVPPVPALAPDRQIAVRNLCEVVHVTLGVENLVTHIEVKFTSDSDLPAVVEMNPRLVGGMLPELYRLVHGCKLYAAAAHLALGNRDVKEFLSGKPNADLALDRFQHPLKGRLMKSDASSFMLPRKFDRFSAISDLGEELCGGTTDEDLPVWTIASGDLKKGQSMEQLHAELAEEAQARVDQWLVTDG